MKTTTRVQLSVMMFLEFFIWGSWYVTMGTYLLKTLQATGTENGATYGAVAIATMVSPFLVGLVADRFFAAQRFMGVLHLLGAGVLFFATTITNPGTFFWVILLYSLFYMPTIALSNSVAFNQMTQPDKEFPGIRVWGTVGWIVTGLLIGGISFESGGTQTFIGLFGKDVATSILPFQVAAVASLILGIFSFFLPHTPPKTTKASSISQVLGLDALILFKDRSYLIFFVSAVLICVPLSFYYNFTNPFLTDAGMKSVTAKMTMGQMSEALFMLLIPLAFMRLGIKNILIVAMIAWIGRFLLFAFGNNEANAWMLYAGIILHGICYDFFFVSGFIYTEKKAGASIKNSAQGLITFATYGLGMFIGSNLSGIIADAYRENGSIQWQSFWIAPALITIGVMIFFVLLFQEKRKKEKEIGNVV
ncbi:MAG: nucleoside permease [Verrucomicrobia bacterium]|nr:nucleoside permease [Cytophagales bacterium]